MFTLPAFNLMQEICPEERDELLRKLNITCPDFSHISDNDYKALDKEIDKKICTMMDSRSDVEGYEKLLKLGGLERNNDTRRDCIARIVANREKILQSNNAPVTEVKLSCNYAKRETFKRNINLMKSLRNFIENLFSSRTEIVTIIARKREINLSESTTQEIKNIVTKELGTNIGEIIISILPPARSITHVPHIENLVETLNILTQVNEINNRISKNIEVIKEFN